MVLTRQNCKDMQKNSFLDLCKNSHMKYTLDILVLKNVYD